MTTKKTEVKKDTKSKGLLVKDAFLASVFGCLLIGLLSLLVINISFFNPLKKVIKDFSFLDVYYADNMEVKNGVDPDIVLINIEHRDRFELAMLLEQVLSQNPKAVGIDMIFKELREPYSDSLLKTALNDSRIVRAIVIEPQETIVSHGYFESNLSTNAFVNLNFDRKSSVIRDFTGAVKSDEDLQLSFASRIIKQTMSNEQWNNQDYKALLLGDTPIRYYGDYDSFLSFEYDEFIMLDNPELLKDKIVLLGYLGIPMGNPYDVEDKHFTPLNKVTAGKSIPDMHGIVIHANIIHMLLNNSVMYRVSNTVVGLLSFLLSFCLIAYFMWLKAKDKISFRTIKTIVLFLFTIIITFLSLWLFKQGIILNAVPLIAVPLLCSSYVIYYTHLIKYIQTKCTWKSYLT